MSPPSSTLQQVAMGDRRSSTLQLAENSSTSPKLWSQPLLRGGPSPEVPSQGPASSGVLLPGTQGPKGPLLGFEEGSSTDRSEPRESGTNPGRLALPVLFLHLAQHPFNPVHLLLRELISAVNP